MNYVLTAIIIFMIYLSVYSIVNRICNCIEHCAISKAFCKTVESGKEEEVIEKFKQEGLLR